MEGLQHAGFNKIRFDWFFAICNITPTTYKGTIQATQLMRKWSQHYLTILQVITQHTILGSAIIIAPLQYPNFYNIFSKIWTENPICNWHLSHQTAQGPPHDAPVSTFHNIIYLGPPGQGPRWTSQGKAAHSNKPAGRNAIKKEQMRSTVQLRLNCPYFFQTLHFRIIQIVTS